MARCGISKRVSKPGSDLPAIDLTMPENTLFTYRTSISAGRFFPDRPRWDEGEPAVIDRYWNGVSALREKGYNWNNLTEVLSLWDSEYLYFRFDCWYEKLALKKKRADPLLVDESPDILMIFLRLPGCEDYFEIAISPDGNWRDLHIRVPHLRINQAWSSGLTLDCCIEEEQRIWKGRLRLPYAHLSVDGGVPPLPGTGDVWRVSFARVIDGNPDIEYLSWRPTFTSRPDFHVPHSFGILIFMEG